MKPTFFLGVCVLLGALLVATAVVSLNAHVRVLSNDLSALTREVSAIGEDVKSLADDMATLTDSLTQEDEGADDDEPCLPSNAPAPGGV